MEKKLIMTDEGLDYTESELEVLKDELEMWEDRGRLLGRELRQVSQWTSETRKKLEAVCNEVYGHLYGLEGSCTYCDKPEEPTE